MGLLTAVESWWNDDGWRRVVAAVVKFGVIELGVTLLVLVVADTVLQFVVGIPVLPRLPVVQRTNLLAGLSFVVYRLSRASASGSFERAKLSRDDETPPASRTT
jgi:hypothetical protein